MGRGTSIRLNQKSYKKLGGISTNEGKSRGDGKFERTFLTVCGL